MPDAAPIPARIRRDRMLSLVREREFVRVAELAERFEVSEVTVRTDLDALADRGLLRRVRGGAVPGTGPLVERRFEESTVAAAAEKRDIARAAAAMVQSGETVILDVGTTTTAIAQELARRDDLHDVTVFTSSLTIAMALEAATPGFTVVVTGGTLRPAQHSLVEPLAGLVLAQIRAGIAFLGCNGVDVRGGVTNVNLPETQVKKLILQAAQRRVICADHTKLGAVALAHVCSLDEVDLLLTDRAADPELLDELRETGLTIQLA
ncbi:DeoR/GlpR family DNA-binding transcription regulator [Egicoccus halophilus]|uniref:Transcriptional regulator n=1 Tax=Egicoccus halophilus TaxID=1670830 RepID=A0A8J3A5F1_9ACTN|nr:DeoR/GlpR family DNA-binding transcription regulator [Egicoccus halophilus]GGI03520.1 transcriptional regulator [Egicoccus halophilus]